MPQDSNKGKRLQVDKDKTTVFAVLAVSAVIFVGGIMTAKGFWGQATYYSKVAEKKETARNQLEENKVAVGELSKSYDELTKETPNLLGGSPDGTGERDGNNGQLILDALPNKYDFPALAASLEKILIGYDINSISGVDDSLNQQQAAAAGPVEIPFDTNIVTNYDGLKLLISSFNRSIRPFQITKLDLSGSNSTLQVTLTGKSFYQPDLGLQITKETVE